MFWINNFTVYNDMPTISALDGIHSVIVSVVQHGVIHATLRAARFVAYTFQDCWGCAFCCF